jgi:hypothetical protein
MAQVIKIENENLRHVLAGKRILVEKMVPETGFEPATY